MRRSANSDRSMESKDWASVSYEDARATLRQWREENARRSEETVEIWEHVLSRHPSDLGDELWIVYEQVCVAALDCARIDVATECLLALSKQFSNSMRVSKLQAMRYEALEKYDDASAIYERLIKLDPTNAGFRKRRIAVMKSQGDTVGALNALVEYLEDFINDSEGWLELSNMYLAQCDYARAAHCLEEILLANPHNSLYLQRYADIKYTLGGMDNVELAKSYFAQALHVNPTSIRSLYGLLLSCQWLSQKSTGQKRKEYSQMAIKAADQLIARYSANSDSNPNADEQIAAIKQMMQSISATSSSI